MNAMLSDLDLFPLHRHALLRQKGSGLLNSLTECDSECVIAHVVENPDYQSSPTLRVEKLGLDMQK